jgi:hypothetical protein
MGVVCGRVLLGMLACGSLACVHRGAEHYWMDEGISRVSEGHVMEDGTLLRSSVVNTQRAGRERIGGERLELWTWSGRMTFADTGESVEGWLQLSQKVNRRYSGARAVRFSLDDAWDDSVVFGPELVAPVRAGTSWEYLEEMVMFEEHTVPFPVLPHRSVILEDGLVVEVPAGRFEDCVHVRTTAASEALVPISCSDGREVAAELAHERDVWQCPGFGAVMERHVAVARDPDDGSICRTRESNYQLVEVVALR